MAEINIYFQVIVVLFALFALSRAFLRFREGKMSLKEMLFWILLWASVIFVVFFSRMTFIISRIFGIGRGIDLVVYVSIVALFYLIFRIYVKIENIEQDITKIVREVALRKRGKIKIKKEK
ncbi:MAG TPA: DUF2304 family protein [Candidatus Nanoarchaeia archaeon]|nr:DUF2304 family protein [Candidatus Nanoarchaeia archaeon]